MLSVLFTGPGKRGREGKGEREDRSLGRKEGREGGREGGSLSRRKTTRD